MSEQARETFERTGEPQPLERQLSLVALSAADTEPVFHFDPLRIKAWYRQLNSRTQGDYLSDPDETSLEALTDETVALVALYGMVRRKDVEGMEATLDQLLTSFEVGVPEAAKKHHVSSATIHNKKGDISDKLATELDRLIGGIEPEAPVRAPRQRKASTASLSRGKVALQAKPESRSTDKDSVGMYLEEVTKNGLLNAELEVELAKTIEAGLMADRLLQEGRVGRRKGGAPMSATKEELEWMSEEGKRAFDRFVTSNLRLVVSLAKRYTRSNLPLADLIQDGNTGLIHAVEKFDYQKGYKFSTYATWWVRQTITRGISHEARAVQLPVHVLEEINQVNSARRTLEKQLGREPKVEEIAAELEKDIARVTDLIIWSQEHVSLDTPVDEAGTTTLGDLILQDVMPGPESDAVATLTRERLLALVNKLGDERLIDIVLTRYGFIDDQPHSLVEIGKKHNITAERVRQLEKEARARLQLLANQDTEQFTT